MAQDRPAAECITDERHTCASWSTGLAEGPAWHDRHSTVPQFRDGSGTSPSSVNFMLNRSEAQGRIVEWAAWLRPARVGLATIAMVVLVACGGGGGGGSTSPPSGPATPDGTADGGASFTTDYVPLNTGDRRLWSLSSSATPGASSLVPAGYAAEAIGGRSVAAGLPAYEVRDETGDRVYWSKSDNALVEIPGPDGDPIGRAVGAFDVLRFGLRQGEQVRLVDREVDVDVDGDRLSDRIRLIADFRVVGFGAVSVPAGPFVESAQVRTEATLNGTLASGGRFSTTVTLDQWFVQGIGMVRSVTVTDGGTAAASTELQELQAYRVGDRRSETVAPRLEVVSPMGGASRQSPPRIAVRFSEPVDLSSDDPNGFWLLTGPGGQTQRVAANVADLGLRVDLPLGTILPEGVYTLSPPGAVVDWAGNPLQSPLPTLVVDATGPELLSAQPARGVVDAPVTGTVGFRFSEPVVVLRDTAPPVVRLRPWDANGGLGDPIGLPATVNGTTVAAVLTTPLRHNTRYSVELQASLTDLAGNPVAATPIVNDFTTDPGPLSNPVRWVGEQRDVQTMRFVDVDGDGRQDLLYVGSEWAASATAPIRLMIRPGRASGGLGDPQALLTLNSDARPSCSVRSMTTGDFDADGRLDVAIFWFEP
jgi:hypothetical protein